MNRGPASATPSPVTDLHDARLTIDLDALAANYAALKARAGNAEVAPAVKANAFA